MKKTIARIAAAATLLLAAVTAQAGPFQFGPVVGVNINSLSLTDTKSNFDSSNRSGFTGGLMAKFTVPVINIGADLSVMYVRRNGEMTIDDNNTEKFGYDYISVPLHVRYDLGLPAISNIIVPYIFTGPNFAFRVSKDVVDDVMHSKKYNVGWDLGLGITLIKHLQINAAYTWNTNKALNYTGLIQTEGAGIKGKTNGWTVTAGWLF